MTHQGWDVQLTAYAARDWRAKFFPVDPAPIVGGLAREPTPWRAVQRAAWTALTTTPAATALDYALLAVIACSTTSPPGGLLSMLP
jgi:hypothetical protein